MRGYWLAPALLFAMQASGADESGLLPCADGSGPRAAVMGYLTAMHEQRFADAFDFVTATMTDGRERAAWSELQAKAYGPGKVKIYGVDIRRAMSADGDPECRARAIVPNILSSRDKLNVHGNIEFEIYTVERDGEQWRVDSQETLFDDTATRKWFPESRVIEVGGPE